MPPSIVVFACDGLGVRVAECFVPLLTTTYRSPVFPAGPPMTVTESVTPVSVDRQVDNCLWRKGRRTELIAAGSSASPICFKSGMIATSASGISAPIFCAISGELP